MRKRAGLSALILTLWLAAAPVAAAVGQPVTERERFEAEQAYRNRQLAQAERESDLRREEQERARWTSPLVLAIVAAAIAALGNAAVAFFNGRQQRILEKTRADANRKLEAQKAKDQLELENSKAAAQRELDAQQAESDRILEAIKTEGSREAAVGNLEFLLKAGLVSSEALTKSLSHYLETRAPGTGPTLPSAGGRFDFDPAAPLTPDAKAAITKTLEEFSAYLDHVGFDRPTSSVSIGMAETELSYYMPDERRVMLGSVYRDDYHICRAFTHHVLLGAAPTRSETAGFHGMESGLADYFPCSFLDGPAPGDGKRRIDSLSDEDHQMLASPKGFADLSDWKEGIMLDLIHDDREVWRALFWDIRGNVGAEIADRLLRSAWTEMKWPKAESRVVPEYVRTLTKVADEGEAKDAAAVRAVLVKRGFLTGPGGSGHKGDGRRHAARETRTAATPRSGRRVYSKR